MLFLDERIKFTISVGAHVEDLPEKGIYTYSIRARDDWEQTGFYTIFVGNFYYNKTFNQTLDVTDIIRNNVGDYSSLSNALHNPYAMKFEIHSDNAIQEYWVVLTMQKDGQTITRASSHQLVAKVYRYPNRSPYTIMSGAAQFLDYSSNTFKNTYTLLLQGMKWLNDQHDEDVYALVPRYPCKSTEQYGVGVTFAYGTSVQSIPLVLSDGTNTYNFTLDNGEQGAGTYNATWVASLGEILDDYLYDVENQHIIPGDNLNLYYTAGSKNILIGKLDKCYSRYYIQWLDRFGGIQSQPFRDNATFSEDIDKEEIITYDDKRHTSLVSIQPKWKLNSDWIDDKVFPLYESIFTSPFLILYDTETAMNYEVIINDKYIEKTYKNQKGLINIELNLEAVEKQNMLY